MDYTMMISKIYADEVPVNVVASMINIGYTYHVKFTTEVSGFTMLELDVNGVGAVRVVFRYKQNCIWEAVYSLRSQSLKVSKYAENVTTVKTEIGNYIFSAVILALSTRRFFDHNKPYVTCNNFKDYMIPARLVKTMLDSLMSNTDIELVKPNNGDTNIMSLAKSVKCDDYYIFIEDRLSKHTTNVYTYSVGKFVTSNRYDDNVPEQWIHVEAVKQMLQEYKQMLINSKESSKSVTVNINVALD